MFREYVPKWQTQYIGKLNLEYIELPSSDGDAADHFWELEERIKKDKKHPGVSFEISKGDTVYDLFLLCRTDVIDMSDLEEFSDSTRGAVRQLLDLR